MKRIKYLALAATCVLATAGFAKERLPEPTMRQMASCYYAYPYLEETPPEQTPAPAGYEPFHLEHYGRHGSRWLINPKDYETPVTELEKAERNGKLTPFGSELLAQLRKIREASRLREGDLSDVGALQHQAIARRMYENYPQIFAPGTHVDARSTLVFRVALSMLNEVKTLQGLEPTLNITTDASASSMNYLNHGDTDQKEYDILKSYRKIGMKKLEEEKAKHKAPGRFLSKLITDPKFAADSIDTELLARRMVYVLGNTQSHTDQPWILEDVMDYDEVREEWLKENMAWFVGYGNTALSGNVQPYSQRFLLRNFIESADTAVVSPGVSANLRFGHDTMVYPLATLMNLDGVGDEVNDLGKVHETIRNYRIVPMATNIQLVFYRPENSTNPDDVLVKVLFNEEEVSLPFPAVSGPYYSWPAFRKFYMDKINAFKVPAPYEP